MKRSNFSIWTFIFTILSCTTTVSYGQLLSDNIPFPFYEVQKAEDGFENKMMILNSGIASLQKRIDIIRNADDHIEVEYFIYGLDEGAQIITQELVAAAKRGVKVRILVDKSRPIFVLKDIYASVLNEYGIEVKYYNDSTLFKLSYKALLALSDINFRNHRKLISVDDKYAITGGRNIGNDYFDLSGSFNFLDRDVYIEGDMVKTMRLSFDKYWEHKISVRPKLYKKPRPTRRIRKTGPRGGNPKRVVADNYRAIKRYEEKVAPAKALITNTAELEEIRKKVEKIARPILESNKLLSCPETTYSTDAPGGKFWTRLIDHYGDEYRYLRKTLFDKASAVNKKIIVSSPYMINNGYSRSLMFDVLNKGVEVDLYTNSLASTDAIYVAANLYKDVYAWADLGIKIFVHDGKFVKENAYFDPKVKQAKWGTHSKTQIYIDEDYSEFMIGTYNIDNRSNHYNNEMAIFCKGNDELTSIVQENIYDRIQHAYQIHDDGTATDSKGRLRSVLGSKKDDLLKMKLISLPSWLLDPLL